MVAKRRIRKVGKMGKKKPKTKPLARVELEWDDAHSDEEWHDGTKEKHAETMRMTCIGYLVEWTDKAIVICRGVDPEGDYDGKLTIPASWATKVTSLRKNRIMKKPANVGE